MAEITDTDKINERIAEALLDPKSKMSASEAKKAVTNWLKYLLDDKAKASNHASAHGRKADNKPVYEGDPHWRGAELFQHGKVVGKIAKVAKKGSEWRVTMPETTEPFRDVGEARRGAEKMLFVRQRDFPLRTRLENRRGNL